MDPATALARYEELRSGDWRLHGWAPDVYVDWGLNRTALDWLFAEIRPGWRTLETGAGLSTIVFALKGAHHTVISPDGYEHDRIREWCAARDVPLDTVTFVAARSQEVLPGLAGEPLDLALVDGDHAFPIPFVDYWYAGSRLRQGGRLVVDDTHLRAVEVLRDFLRGDEPRWRRVASMPTTEVFEKRSTALLPPEGWAAQPWGAQPRRVAPAWPVRAWRQARASIRLRTRVRALIDRGHDGRSP